MLSIGKLGKGQERYYLDKVAEGAEEYYSGEGEVAGEWLGDAAEDLGLSGGVEAAQLEAVLAGRTPGGGGRGAGGRRGWAPALWAEGGPARSVAPGPRRGGGRAAGGGGGGPPQGLGSRLRSHL